MIIRIVKMKFQAEKVGDFLQLFEQKKLKIEAWDGCTHLELWQDEQDANTFFTYSHWQSEEQLNAYRAHPFFRETWKISKSFFSEAPQAWSVKKRY